MHWFYDPDILPESQVISTTELKHLGSLRIRSGEEIVITNGQGAGYRFVLKDPKSGALTFVSALSTAKPHLTIHLVQALAKGDRDELAIQAAIELGATSVVPWQAEHSVANWKGKEEKSRARWQQIAIAAMKQSQQVHLAEVGPLSLTPDLKPIGHGIVLDPGASRALSELPETAECTIVVGPEGGISQAELEMLEKSGFVRYRLGHSVLRTSTAGPAAIAALLALRGVW